MMSLQPGKPFFLTQPDTPALHLCPRPSTAKSLCALLHKPFASTRSQHTMSLTHHLQRQCQQQPRHRCAALCSILFCRTRSFLRRRLFASTPPPRADTRRLWLLVRSPTPFFAPNPNVGHHNFNAVRSACSHTLNTISTTAARAPDVEVRAARAAQRDDRAPLAASTTTSHSSVSSGRQGGADTYRSRV